MNIAVNNPEFLDYIRQNRVIYPLVASIDVAAHCNCKCIHCYIGSDLSNAEKPEIPFSKLREFLDELGSYGVASVNLTGGEALLRTDILDIIRYAKERSIYVCLRTNGIRLLDESFFDSFLQALPDEVVVSIYGMSDRQCYEVTRNPMFLTEGTLNRFLSTLLKLRESNIKLVLRYVVLKQNHSGYLDFIKWCDSKDISRSNALFTIDIYPENNGNNDTTDCCLTGQELKDFFRKINEYDNDLIKTNYGNKKTYEHCLVGRHLIHVTSNGDVYPCPNFPLVVGNIYNSTFVNIWENSILLNRVRDIGADDLECRDCSMKEKCYRRCIGAFYTWSKHITYTKPREEYCNIKKEITEALDDVLEI